ncbi:MAG: hypothetical protein RIS22_503 [Actinomycetota bacterium]|jgi:hypothetical protein
MDAFTNLPEHQKAEFLRHLEDEQMKESLKYVAYIKILVLNKKLSVFTGCTITWCTTVLTNALWLVGEEYVVKYLFIVLV